MSCQTGLLFGLDPKKEQKRSSRVLGTKPYADGYPQFIVLPRKELIRSNCFEPLISMNTCSFKQLSLRSKPTHTINYDPTGIWFKASPACQHSSNEELPNSRFCKAFEIKYILSKTRSSYS
jgi:hypothetical protein